MKCRWPGFLEGHPRGPWARLCASKAPQQSPFFWGGGHLLHVGLPTATRDPRHICNLHHSSGQCQILNPLRDQTHILMDTSQVHYRWVTMGTPIHTVIFFQNGAVISRPAQTLLGGHMCLDIFEGRQINCYLIHAGLGKSLQLFESKFYWRKNNKRGWWLFKHQARFSSQEKRWRIFLLSPNRVSFGE